MENTFGLFLKEKRQEKKLTQKQLAEMLFVSESAVSKWEKNVSHPDITLLPKLSEILGVTEHELITASVDKQARTEKSQAKKWRAVSMSWNLFFYISYVVALIPCFICNLAINKTLSWFWIVLSALILAFTLTNLPQFIKKYRLIFIPSSMFLALCLLLGVCCIYTQGTWFWVASLSTLFGLFVIFFPIYLSKYNIFSTLKKYRDFISVGLDFVFLLVLLAVINIYTVVNGFSSSPWFFIYGLPISIICYVLLSLFMCVRFINVNKLVRTGIVLLGVCSLYLVVPFLHFDNANLQKEIDSANIFKADFLSWYGEVAIERNVHLIIVLSGLLLAFAFLFAGCVLHIKRKKLNK